MLGFGYADTFTNTLDFPTLWRTTWQGNGPELGEREDIEAAWHFPFVAVLNIEPPLAGRVN